MSPAANRRMSLAIDGIDGFWAEPPQWFSFSSMLEAEACPRRWGLRRATYPGLWEGKGYPDSPNVAALAGNVVHESLEILIRALVRSGCVSTQDPEAVAVLRSLGGYSAVIQRVTEEQIRRLENNPRCHSRHEYLRRELTLRRAEMRRATQSLLSRSIIAADVEQTHPRDRSDRSESRATVRRHRPDGSYPELSLRSTRLRMTGRADLVTISGGDVRIVDYKTGAPSEHHSEQLRAYALIWSRHDSLDPTRPYASRLTVSYPNADVEVDAPTTDELDILETQTVARLKDLTNQLAEDPPQARPDEERCRFCPVRHLCDPYWRSFAKDVSDQGFSDLRGQVVEQSGPRSWKLRLASGEHTLLRVSSEAVQYELGAWLRILGAVVSHGSDSSPDIASLVATSEVYVERQSGGR